MLKSSPFWALLVGCAAVLLTGALGRPDDDSAPTAVLTMDATAKQIDAGPLLAEVVNLYSAEKIPWLSMTVWQKVNDDSCPYETKGRFWRGTQERIRLDLNIVRPKPGKVVLVCDGKNLRQICAGVPKEENEETWALPSPQEKDASQNRCRVLAENGFIGPADLLKRLQPRLKNLLQSTGTWESQPIIRITADWNGADNIPDESRPTFVPRSCVIYLDKQSHWPFRIEWWGSNNLTDEQTQIQVLEFRDPVLNQPLPEEECSRLFTSAKL